MADIWSFLLQTLTASGVAALLLLVKAMFRDKLPPRWQFAVWSILGVVVLLPAGLFGRYTLLNWPFYVELFRSNLTGSTVPWPMCPPPSRCPRTLCPGQPPGGCSSCIWPEWSSFWPGTGPSTSACGWR